MRKVISLYFILLGVFSLCQPLSAQNNPYKIDDELYSYYQRCSYVIRDPKVLLMADTLFQKAVRKNDVKAQCLAKNLKSEHYYYTDNISSLLTEKEKVADFARETPYKQYIFGAWNRIITYYLRNHEYDTALQELKKYQDEAIRLNNPYAIGQSYIRMGDIYFQQRMSPIAIKQYMQAENYYRTVGKENELYFVYYAIGTCYTNMGELDKAEKYTIKSIDTAPNLTAKISSYLSLLRIYTKTQEFNKAAKIKTILTEHKNKGTLKAGALANYYIILANYYLATEDLQQASLYSDSIPDPQIRASLKSSIYAKEGNFEAAYSHQQRFIQLRDSLSEISNTEMLASYNARFNNQKLELEKNRLSLQNTEMKLKQSQDRERLMAMEKEQTRIELENRNLQLEQQRTATQLEKTETQKQRLELIHKQEELQRIEMEKTTNKRKGIVIISILTIVTGFSVLYAIARRQHAKRLQVEKEAAESARRQAEKADKLKSAFLQNMSHEIRTPLNAIIGFNDLLNDASAELSPEERQEFLTHLHTNTNLLLTLVNDVLDLSKLESGNYTINLTQVNVTEVCQAALAGVTHRLNKGVELLLHQPAREVNLETDRQRLQQILTNLLVNACKYTVQGSIALAYEVTKDKVIFSVTDTGCGIEKEKAEIIFQRFEKLDSFNTGFGLGLSICRSLTHILGGKIYLDPDYTGGAKFIVELPLQSPA